RVGGAGLAPAAPPLAVARGAPVLPGRAAQRGRAGPHRPPAVVRGRRLAAVPGGGRLARAARAGGAPGLPGAARRTVVPPRGRAADRAGCGGFRAGARAPGTDP